MQRWVKQLAKEACEPVAAYRFVEAAAKYIVSQRNTPTYEIPEIEPIRAVVDASHGLRLNLFIPSINVSDLFGGTYTAVQLFEQLGDILRSSADIRMRIITHRPIRDELVVDLTKWKLSKTHDFNVPYQLIELEDARTRTISFSRSDIFVATWWSTAFRAARLRAWQKRSFRGPIAPLLYIIQDFEPAFYPWSSSMRMPRQRTWMRITLLRYLIARF